MIKIYGDKINVDLLNDEHLWNRYLEQKIQEDSAGPEHFTIHPQINSAAFKFFNEPVEFCTFDQYVPGQKGIVIIGLHGGWSVEKLNLIKKWFLQTNGKRAAWQDPMCQIIIDYSEEGFTTEVFLDLWTWIKENQLTNRVLYVTGSCNSDEVYMRWCQKERVVGNMETAWYGFFINWVLRNHWANNKTIDYPSAHWQNGQKRFMCLNRRPWPHRILMNSLLEHFGILEAGAVSMPLQFEEPDIVWKGHEFQFERNWKSVKEAANGYFDFLDPAYQRLINKLPLSVDVENFSVNRALDLNGSMYENYPVNLITETLFFSESAFASEKIWKPMVMGQIFIVMAAPGYLAKLKELGFKTFHPYINEEYDFMHDPVERSIAIAQNIKRIVNMPSDQFNKLLNDCKPITDYNKKLVTNMDLVDKIASKPLVSKILDYWNLQ